MPRKLEPFAVEDLRAQFAAGETVAVLAEAYGVSERHVRRLTATVRRPPERLTLEPDETVTAAVDRFLSGLTQRTAADDVRAAAARALARKLDRADARSAPAVARALVDVVGELRSAEAPDALDEIRRRRDARRLAMRVGVA